MNKLKLLIVVLAYALLPTALLAQNFINYQTYVRKAELLITEQKIDSAIINYDKAFKQFKQPFVRDVYNAIICNAVNQHYKNAIKLSKYLIDLGVDSAFFSNNEHFKTMLSSKMWSKKIVKAGYFRKNNPSIDTTLRNELYTRYLRDQDVKNPKRKVYIAENAAWLRDRLLVNKFPIFHKTGIFLSDNRIKNDLYEIMLLHYFDQLKPNKKAPLESDSLNLSKLLFDLAKTGQISPTFFSSLNVIGTAYELMPMPKEYYIVVGDSVFVKNTKEVELANIDKKRLELGLHSVENYMKLIRYNSFNKQFMLVAGTNVGIFEESMKIAFKPPYFKNVGHKKEVLNM